LFYASEFFQKSNPFDEQKLIGQKVIVSQTLDKKFGL